MDRRFQTHLLATIPVPCPRRTVHSKLPPRFAGNFGLARFGAKRFSSPAPAAVEDEAAVAAPAPAVEAVVTPNVGVVGEVVAVNVSAVVAVGR